MTFCRSIVPKAVFQIVIGILFGIAIIGVIAKTVFQIKIRKRLRLEDAFLICACVHLTAGTGVLYKLAESLYTPDNLVSLKPEFTPATFESKIIATQGSRFTFLVLIWIAIFCVKFSFLFFFRQPVDPIRGLLLFWRAVVVFTSLSFIVCISEPFFSCPGFGKELLKCGEPERLKLLKRIEVIPIVLDILIDTLIVSIPIYLLWKVRITIHQKFGIGVFLCLNTIMSFVACVRVTGLGLHKPIDLNWEDFWLEIEACIGVLMVSVTAFRTIFVLNASKANHEKAARPWYSSTVERLRARQKPNSEDLEMQGLPTIPTATMTQTFISNGRIAYVVNYDGDLADIAEIQNKFLDSGILPEAYKDTRSTV